MTEIRTYGKESYFNENVTFFKDVTVHGSLNFSQQEIDSLYVPNGLKVAQVGGATTSLIVEGNTLLGSVSISSGIVTSSSGITTYYGDGANLRVNGSSLSDAISAAIPSGSVFWFAKSSAPEGYLKCNGASLSTTTYAALFASIGYTFGGGGSSFNLPDLRGEFIRGWDDSRGIDSGRMFASSQVDTFKSHKHYHYEELLAAFPPNESPRYYWTNTADYINPGYSVIDYTGTPDAGSGTETRPRNIALLACIKY